MTGHSSSAMSPEAVATFERNVRSHWWYDLANASAALAGADECGSDGRGDVWYTHLSPVSGDRFLVILGHSRGRWYEDVWHDGVLSVLQGDEYEGLEVGNWEYDEILAAEETALAGRDRGEYEAGQTHTQLALRRADALVALLGGRLGAGGDGEQVLLLRRDAAKLAEERAWPHFRESCAAWWAWIGWLDGDEGKARALAESAAAVTGSGVAAAAGALFGLLDGRGEFAGVPAEILRERYRAAMALAHAIAP